MHEFENKKLKKQKIKNKKIKEQRATKIKEFNLHEGNKKENMYQKYVENNNNYKKMPSIMKNIMKFDEEYEKKQNE